MPFQTLNLGLELTIPVNGTKNWGETLRQTTWTKISIHNHTGSGDGNKMITASYTDHSVTLIKLAKNNGLFQKVDTLAPIGTTQTVDWNEGSQQKLSLGSASGNVTLTLSNAIAGARYKLFVIQGATARQLTWPASAKWANGQAPILSTTNGTIDIIELYYDGTNFFGDWNVSYA